MTFPPADFIPTESTIEGITIFKPRPPARETHEVVVDFRCPRCDGTTAFSAANGGLTCESCGYYEPPPQETVGRGAAEFEFTVETMERVAHGWGIERNELQCGNCGARTTVAPEMLTQTCPFCDSNRVVQVKAPQDALRPRFLIPFKLEAEEANRRKQAWLGASWMTPGTLQKLASGADFRPVYVPFWTFDARTRADWRAQVGHRRTRTYRSGGKTHTRTEVVWRWESGNVNLFTDDLPVPGTDKISPILLERLADFRMDDLVPYDPSYLAGMSAQAYDIPLDAAWERGRELIRERTKKACESQASTDLIRNFTMGADFAEETWRYILAPVYIAVYQYQNETYQVMVNGQNGTVSGQRPVDWPKVWLAMAACLLPGVLLGLLGLILLIVGVGALVLPFALLAFAGGARYAMKFYREAQAMGEA